MSKSTVISDKLAKEELGKSHGEKIKVRFKQGIGGSAFKINGKKVFLNHAEIVNKVVDGKNTQVVQRIAHLVPKELANNYADLFEVVN